MNSLYDIMNEAKQTKDNVYLITGKDETIHSVWQSKNDADNECKRVNKEIGGKYFNVISCDSSDVMA